MTFDLRTERWLPFTRLSGTREWGPPDLIVDRIDTDPVVALAAPRPDFDGALTEFLVGLLTAAFRLPDESAWHRSWRIAPTRDALRAAILALPPAFDLDGDGPRFLQDLTPADLAEADVAPVQELLVEGKNDSLFIKPETLRQIGRPAAAMALITIQSYSPAGGRGHRTSMRGGGPLTTLVDPRPSVGGAPLERSLWRYLWANVLTLDELAGGGPHATRSPADTFPWLAPTRTSENDRATTVADVDPMQCFFGMPRRIVLEFGQQPGRCDLTGRVDERPVTGFRVKGYGIQYQVWRHPLTPYYEGKTPNEWLPIHGQPGGIGWRDWYPLIHHSQQGKKMPATVVSVFNTKRAQRVERERYSLRAFGFDVTNAKVRSWIDATLPAFIVADTERLDLISMLIKSLVDAADLAAYTLQRATTDAIYGGSDDPPGDLSAIKAALWSATEPAFFAAVDRALDARDLGEATFAICREFQTILIRSAEAVFDAHVSPDPSHPEQLRRSIAARFNLVITLNGGGKQGEKFFAALRLSTPKEKRTRGTAKRTSKEPRT